MRDAVEFLNSILLSYHESIIIISTLNNIEIVFFRPLPDDNDYSWGRCQHVPSLWPVCTSTT